ncbi:DNRLRE domain-containing protein [Saccharibacillus sacchari]|uniref:DNRLRE domain-containing protein n=1 Tax=Saccharibacillus sacchari TaxID=456493 RepID=A0ACC6P7J1_9BACL
MRAKTKWLLSTLLVSSLGAQAVPHSALADPEPAEAPDEKQLQNEKAAAEFVEAPVKVVSEELASRTLYSKEYLLSDNSRETVLSAAPLHYEDGNGDYQDILLALTLQASPPQQANEKPVDSPSAAEPEVQPDPAAEPSPESSDPIPADSEAQDTPSSVSVSSITSATPSQVGSSANRSVAASVKSEPSNEEPSQPAPSPDAPITENPDTPTTESPTPAEQVPASGESVSETPTEQEEAETPLDEGPAPAASDAAPQYTSSTVPYTPSLHNAYAQGFSLGTDGNTITLVPVGAQESQADVSQAAIGQLGYADVWTATDATLALTSSGISQTLNLNSADAPSTFRFAVEGTLDENLTGGGLTLSPAWLTDADGQRREVARTLKETAGVRYLDLDLDPSGLSYPIAVHTGIELQTNVQKATITDEEAGVSNAVSAFARSAPKQPETRTYLQYDLSGLPENAAVREAYLTTDAGESGGDPDTLRVLRAVEPWNEATLASDDEPRTALRADGASYGKLRNEADGTQRIDLDPDLITRWLTDEQPNYGLQIDSGSEPTSFAEAPQLHIRHGGDTVSTLSAAGTPMQFQYFYDDQSRLQYILFSSGERINFTYDTNGNLIQRQYVPGS